ncbi:hypothetical protein APSETT444_003264 [Aspergillus pseudonomiae]
MSAHELKQMAPPVLSEMEGQPIYRDKDDVYLTRMGKRPVLKLPLGIHTRKELMSDRQGSYVRRTVPLVLDVGPSIGNEVGQLYDRSEYVPHPWRKALYAWGLSALSALINIVGGKFLPRFEGTILIFHVLGFFAILVPLTYMADHKSSAEEVFTYFINKGNWPSDALSVFVGLTGPVFAFAGGDAAVHATGSVSGTAIAGALVTSLGCCNTIGTLTAASRQFWSFSRDRGIPGWRMWSKVTERTSIPTYAVLLTAVVGCLLNLITIGSDVAFNSLVSMSISGLYLSYMAAGGLLLYRRCTGGIADATEGEHTMINTAGARLLSAGPAVDRERNAPELSKNGQDKPVAVLSAQWL